MDRFIKAQSDIPGSFSGNSSSNNVLRNDNSTINVYMGSGITGSGVGNERGGFRAGGAEVSRPYRLIPYGRNNTFTGRGHVLESVKRISEREGHNRIALYGLGGSGKTQIALEYVYQRARLSDCDIFWVRGGGVLEFSEGFRAVAQHVGIHLASVGTDGEDFLLGVRRWFEGPKSGDWIMVVDNADNEADFIANDSPVAKFLPQSTKGTLIFTTRSRQVASRQGCQMIEVVKMAEREAEELFSKRFGMWDTLGAEEKKVVATILSSLDHLPLAVVGSAAFMTETSTPPSDYWAIFRGNEERMKKLLSQEFNDIQREAGVTESILSTYFVTFNRISQQMPRAAHLLWLMALLDRQNIPEELLSQCGLEGMDDLLEFRRAIGKLLGLSLVTVVKRENKTFYELHRLVQLSLQVYLPTEDLDQWRATALQVVSRCFPRDDNERRRIGSAYISHALAVTRDSTDPIAEELCFCMGRYFLDMGSYNNAEAQFRQCVVPREEGRECDWDEEGFIRFRFLGEAKLLQGKYDEAEEINRCGIEGCEKILGPDHPTTLASVNNLAVVLRRQGRYHESETLNRRALAGREKALGLDHPDTLISVSNLAWALLMQGKYGESETMERRALEGRENVLGLDHPDTLNSVSNLAWALLMQGKYGESETIERRALEGREKVLGPDRPDTLISVSNLGGTLLMQGKYGESETMYRRALEGREKVLGSDHPDTLTSVSNLAGTLHMQGKYSESETMYRRALEGQEKLLGPDHPDTLASVSNLAGTLHMQGKYGESETMYRRALEGREKVLGPDHPDTLTSVSNLAWVLHYQGRYHASETMERRALEGREKVLGPDHPDTLTSVSNLAGALHMQGKYGESETMYRRALEGREKVLGPDHPDTLISVSNLGGALLMQGKYSESETMYQRALEGREKVPGPDPLTRKSARNPTAVLGKQRTSDELDTVDQPTQQSLPIKLNRTRPPSTSRRAMGFLKAVLSSKDNGRTK